MIDKPYSSACERNQSYILEQLEPLLVKANHVLEIGSGTGQHAVYFAKALPHIQWQTSDLDLLHAGIEMWLQEENLENVLSPFTFDVDNDDIIGNYYDAVFTANTFHIMRMDSVCHCIQKVGHALKPGGLFIIYGPFKFNGTFTSESNEKFDMLLKTQQKHRGIRDFEKIYKIAESVSLFHEKSIPMPANNFMLIFRKINSERKNEK